LNPIACGYLPRRRLGAGNVEIGDRHRGAILGEPLGGRRTDSARPAGDQRHPPFRSSCHAVLPRDAVGIFWLGIF
jgi:hypothetical protein